MRNSKRVQKIYGRVKECKSQISGCEYPDVPKKLNFFETAIRTLLKKYANRGKVDIFISYEDLSQQQMNLKYNAALAAEYMRYFQQMSEAFQIENDVKVSALSHYPEVLTMEEQAKDEEILWSGLKEALEGAFEQFVETRILEGTHLKGDILEKLSGMETLVGQVESRSPQIVAEYRTKLEEKVKELLSDTQIEENRIAAEVILFADKICTDEEVVRLKSHISHMRDTLEEKEGIGRKARFYCTGDEQEKANTILSKANDLEVSKLCYWIKNRN